jgi:hypothetical protein
MRNIPINLGGYRLMISEAPTMKTRKGKNGQDEVVTDNDGVTKFVVSLFAKIKGQKGEEIKVTLATDPGDGFDEGELVELVNPVASPYSFKNDRDETVAGIAFSAAGLKPLG